MANGSPTRPRTTGVFSGLLLIIFGGLLLLHNYGHLRIVNVFKHGWPLIFIFWGATKLYERTIAERQGRSSGWITPGEVFLVVGLMTIGWQPMPLGSPAQHQNTKSRPQA